MTKDIYNLLPLQPPENLKLISNTVEAHYHLGKDCRGKASATDLLDTVL